MPRNIFFWVPLSGFVGVLMNSEPQAALGFDHTTNKEIQRATVPLLISISWEGQSRAAHVPLSSHQSVVWKQKLLLRLWELSY